MSDDAGALAANQAFYDAFARGDLAGVETLWARAHPVTCIHPGWDVLTGRAAVLESWGAIFRGGDAGIRASDARVTVSGDIACVVCHEGAAGAPAMLVATNLFVREAGGWKMIHHHAGPLARRAAPRPAGPMN